MNHAGFDYLMRDSRLIDLPVGKSIPISFSWPARSPADIQFLEDLLNALPGKKFTVKPEDTDRRCILGYFCERRLQGSADRIMLFYPTDVISLYMRWRPYFFR